MVHRAFGYPAATLRNWRVPGSYLLRVDDKTHHRVIVMRFDPSTSYTPMATRHFEYVEYDIDAQTLLKRSAPTK